MYKANTVTVPQTAVATECVTWRWNGNLGDDMIFAAQAAMFGDLVELGQYLDAPQALLVGGGTFIPKYPHHPELVRLSRELPTVIFGTGVGDPLFWGTDYIPPWLEIVGNAGYVGVRGPLSQERLQEWGCDGSRIDWIGDAALYFARPAARIRPNGGRLAVNLGTTYDTLYGFSDATVEAAIVTALRRLVRLGWEVTLVSAWAPDDAVLERVSLRVPVVGIERWHDDHEAALRSVERFDVVLCEKLHVAVTAACRGVPFVALNYRSKVMDFCRSLGWEAFCLGTERLDPEDMVGLIDVLGASREQHAHRLQAAAMETRERLLHGASRALSVLTGATR